MPKAAAAVDVDGDGCGDDDDSTATAMTTTTIWATTKTFIMTADTYIYINIYTIFCIRSKETTHELRYVTGRLRRRCCDCCCCCCCRYPIRPPRWSSRSGRVIHDITIVRRVYIIETAVAACGHTRRGYLPDVVKRRSKNFRRDCACSFNFCRRRRKFFSVRKLRKKNFPGAYTTCGDAFVRK